jgi:CRISPR-associated protein Cmr6
VGLWLDKLIWRDKKNFDLKAGTRTFSLGQLCGHHESTAGAAAAQRMLESARGLGGRLFGFEATVDGRLLVGYGRASAPETALTFHRVWGVPLIPGSALKGIARAAADRSFGLAPSTIEGLFGEMGQRGALDFWDAIPGDGSFELALDILTPHVRGYYEGRFPPADWLRPEPFAFVAVVRTRFRFIVRVEDMGKPALTAKDIDHGVRLLREALTEDGVGAKTAAGYGRFRDFKNL